VNIPLGPSRPDQYYSQASRFPSPVKSILQANTQVRALQQDCEHMERHGLYQPYDPKIWEVRSRYRSEIVDAGQATKKKCCDDIC
jgi:hypothetical protein